MSSSVVPLPLPVPRCYPRPSSSRPQGRTSPPPLRSKRGGLIIANDKNPYAVEQYSGNLNNSNIRQ